jgi:hypothetical protein
LRGKMRRTALSVIVIVLVIAAAVYFWRLRTRTYHPRLSTYGTVAALEPGERSLFSSEVSFKEGYLVRYTATFRRGTPLETRQQMYLNVFGDEIRESSRRPEDSCSPVATERKSGDAPGAGEPRIPGSRTVVVKSCYVNVINSAFYDRGRRRLFIARSVLPARLDITLSDVSIISYTTYANGAYAAQASAVRTSDRRPRPEGPWLVRSCWPCDEDGAPPDCFFLLPTRLGESRLNCATGSFEEYAASLNETSAISGSPVPDGNWRASLTSAGTCANPLALSQAIYDPSVILGNRDTEAAASAIFSFTNE